jgi:hypothetical protein
MTPLELAKAIQKIEMLAAKAKRKPFRRWEELDPSEVKRRIQIAEELQTAYAGDDAPSKGMR